MDKVTVCSSCDLVVKLDEHDQYCPRCGKKLLSTKNPVNSDIAVVSVSAIIFLIISIVEPYMSINSMGLTANMSLLSIVDILEKQWGGLLYCFLFFTFFAPLYVLVTIFCTCGLKFKPNILVGKIYSFNHKMCMVDVFILGIIVSLVKLTSLAEVVFYTGFYTSFIFSILLLWCCINYKPEKLWNEIKPQEKIDLNVGDNAKDQQVKCCHECGYIYKSTNTVDTCPRCKAKNEYRISNSIVKSCCLLIAALIFYLPSNLYPVMYTEFLFRTTGSNIIDGVVAMWKMNSYFVAIVILVASIFIPAFKILSLGYILYVSSKANTYNKLKLSKLYRCVLFIGRWSLIDVYVVIIMSSIVRIGGILTIYPGFAIVCFCSVVLITIFSAESFDERLIWDDKNEK
ncbi:MAG: paraquat-inducible protein A [Succinivibrio sp.]|nr:paraquat-inducible protein A [Succinivibrio sp.]